MNRDAIRRRNNKIVDCWNMGVNTLAQLGVAFNMPRNSVGRILTEARKAGQQVLSVGLGDRSDRMSRGQQHRQVSRAGAPANSSLTPAQSQTADGGQTSETAPTPTI